MKLYVWTEVLRIASDGIMFALAESVEQARALLREKTKNLCDCEPDESKETFRYTCPELYASVVEKEEKHRREGYVCMYCEAIKEEPTVYENEPMCEFLEGGDW